jgi:hypothetical protein
VVNHRPRDGSTLRSDDRPRFAARIAGVYAPPGDLGRCAHTGLRLTSLTCARRRGPHWQSSCMSAQTTGLRTFRRRSVARARRLLPAHPAPTSRTRFPGCRLMGCRVMDKHGRLLPSSDRTRGRRPANALRKTPGETPDDVLSCPPGVPAPTSSRPASDAQRMGQVRLAQRHPARSFRPALPCRPGRGRPAARTCACAVLPGGARADRPGLIDRLTGTDVGDAVCQRLNEPRSRPTAPSAWPPARAPRHGPPRGPRHAGGRHVQYVAADGERSTIPVVETSSRPSPSRPTPSPRPSASRAAASSGALCAGPRRCPAGWPSTTRGICS